MATMNFSVPDDVKDAFNKVFEGQNKSAVVTALMREAVEREARRQRSVAAIDRILANQADAPRVGNARIAAARRKGRP
jgi:predicted transcriptional regulator